MISLIAALTFITLACMYYAYRAGVVNERESPGDSPYIHNRADVVAMLKLAWLTAFLITLAGLILVNLGVFPHD